MQQFGRHCLQSLYQNSARYVGTAPGASGMSQHLDVSRADIGKKPEKPARRIPSILAKFTGSASTRCVSRLGQAFISNTLLAHYEGAGAIPLSIRIPGRATNTIFAAWASGQRSPSLAAKGKVKVRDAMQITEGWNVPFAFWGVYLHHTGVPSPP